MKILTLETEFFSSPEIVYNCIVHENFYTYWTEAFHPGSTFIGNWNEGSKIQFIGPDENGKMGGITSHIVKNIPFQEIWIEHLGLIADGKEDFESDEVKAWAPSYERYFLEKTEKGTRFRLEMQANDDWYEMMKEGWEKSFVLFTELTNNLLHVSVEVSAPLEKVWEYFTNAEHIIHWNFADESWHCPKAINDLQVGGKLVATMAAKDGSASFDFETRYTKIVPLEYFEYAMEALPELEVKEIRRAVVQFTKTPNGTRIEEIFEAEKINSKELQQSGWQAILENFKKYVEQ